ncbi:MAG: hypothetical protein JWO53_1097 [Chlamydiia bacterium]|nr:hypothetical protein [Chlamydiia bacterium]
MLQAVSLFGAHLDKIGLVYQIGETASFYVQNQSPQLYERIDKIRQKFIIASEVVGAVCCIKLLCDFERKWKIISILLKNSGRGLAFFILGCGGTTVGVATGVVILANRYFKPKVDPQTYLIAIGASAEAQKATTIEWSRSSRQESIQVILCARLVVNVALTCFAISPYYLLATVALQTIGLGIMARWKMLAYTRTFDRFNILGVVGQDADGQPQLGELRAVDQRIRRVQISYFRPMLFPMNYRNDGCAAYCGDEGASASSQICANHVAHDQCIVGSIYTALERFTNPQYNFWLFNFYASQRLRHVDKYGRIERVVWTLRIAQETFPGCPACRNQPSYGEMEIAIEDTEQLGRFTSAEVLHRTKATLRN